MCGWCCRVEVAGVLRSAQLLEQANILARLKALNTVLNRQSKEDMHHSEKLFKLKAPFKPTGDQPEAVAKLLTGLEAGENRLVLQGVTGSGKTFTMANLIEKWNRPTLILSHNKTLAAQLFAELKEFFPENSVEYFISYYDYYQPEAYIPQTDTYIEHRTVQHQTMGY